MLPRSFSTLRIDKLTNVETFFPFFVITSSFLSKPDLCLPTHFTCGELLLAFITLSATHTFGMTPLDARSARHRAFYLTTRYSQETNFVPPAGFKPTVPANVRPQTYTMVCAATGISFCRHSTKNVKGNVFKIKKDKTSIK